MPRRPEHPARRGRLAGAGQGRRMDRCTDCATASAQHRGTDGSLDNATLEGGDPALRGGAGGVVPEALRGVLPQPQLQCGCRCLARHHVADGTRISRPSAAASSFVSSWCVHRLIRHDPPLETRRATALSAQLPPAQCNNLPCLDPRHSCRSLLRCSGCASTRRN